MGSTRNLAWRWLATAGMGVSAAACGGADTGGTSATLCDATASRAPSEVRDDGRVRHVFWTGDLGCLGPGRLADEAVRFMEASSFDGAAGDETWRARVPDAGFSPDALGRIAIRLDQYVGDVPVEDVGVVLQVNAATQAVVVVSGAVVRAPEVTAPAIGADEAMALALLEAGIVPLDPPPPAELRFAAGENSTAEPTWRQEVIYDGPEGVEVDRIFASAIDGSLVDRDPQLMRDLFRTVHNGGNSDILLRLLLPVILIEGGSSNDAHAQGAYDHAGTAWEYYAVVHGRDSFDARGGWVLATVHHERNLVNAFWVWGGMYFGDGDGGTYGPLGEAADVVVHEFTHGVTEHSAGLRYKNESGALNEAFSDIFAAAATARAQGMIDASTWDVGEDLGRRFRSMTDPAATACFDFYPLRFQGTADNGGVHSNSGIANLAFALLVNGGTHPRGRSTVNVTALGMEKAERIFYRALTHYLMAWSDFQGARNATAQAAADLYGGWEFQAVHEAWDAVGVPGSWADCNPEGEIVPPEPDAGPTDTCTAITTCGACVREGVCGWCGDRCVSGSSSGPDDSGESCPSWAYEPAECADPGPDPAPSGDGDGFVAHCHVDRSGPNAPNGTGPCAVAWSARADARSTILSALALGLLALVRRGRRRR